MLAQNIGRKQFVRSIRNIVRNIVVITIEVLANRCSFYTISVLERPTLTFKHTLYILVWNSSTDLFGKFGTHKCPDHVWNNARSQHSYFYF
eukprot:2327317-Heterocapsa_arctica.AAC.1